MLDISSQLCACFSESFHMQHFNFNFMSNACAQFWNVKDAWSEWLWCKSRSRYPVATFGLLESSGCLSSPKGAKQSRVIIGCCCTYEFDWYAHESSNDECVCPHRHVCLLLSSMLFAIAAQPSSTPWWSKSNLLRSTPLMGRCALARRPGQDDLLSF